MDESSDSNQISAHEKHKKALRQIEKDAEFRRLTTDDNSFMKSTMLACIVVSIILYTLFSMF